MQFWCKQYLLQQDVEWIDQNYFDPEDFIRTVNTYVTTQLASPPETITETLIKGEKQDEVYVYNGQSRFYIPDEETAFLLFGPDWVDYIQEIKVKQLKDLPEGDPIPSMKIKS